MSKNYRFSGLFILLFFLPLLGSLSADTDDFGFERYEDGFYLVRERQVSKMNIGRIGEEHFVLVYEPETLAGEKQQKEFVVLNKSPFVPMILDRQPQKVEDKTKRTVFWLQIKLTQSAALKLEKFTTVNLGKAGAIVIAEKVISIHKIRSVIKDGKLQISRCKDNACKVLYTDLLKNIEKKEK
ncbi:hypothetical protein ACFL35_04620 [Candidatus Riflebacteria bacterium]